MVALSAPCPPVRDTSGLDQAVQRLAQARSSYSQARTHLSDLEATFRQQPDVLEALDAVAATQAEQEAADAALRTLLLDLYQATGCTRFDSAGEVRLVQTPVYLVDEPTLIEEVAAVMPDLIMRQVDRRRLEKRLRHEPQAQIPGVVEVAVAPKVFLSRTLERPTAS
jgi:hypothetical protein